MKHLLKFAGAVALTGALAIAAATPGQARHARHKVAVATNTVPAVTAYSGSCCAYIGSYYSRVYNPRFGYVPELGYSNAVSFRIYPQSD